MVQAPERSSFGISVDVPKGHRQVFGWMGRPPTVATCTDGPGRHSSEIREARRGTRILQIHSHMYWPEDEYLTSGSCELIPSCHIAVIHVGALSIEDRSVVVMMIEEMATTSRSSAAHE